MSTPSVDKELQERLREASAIGDIDEVRTLVESGVNVNSQNEINGWTCLHWACKRNHRHIVAYLLNSGADKDILTSKDELAAQLTSKPDIRSLLGVEEDEVPELKEPDLPIVASYLSSAPFVYNKPDSDSLALEPCVTHNGVADHSHNCHGNRSPSPAPSPPRPPEQSLMADARSQREAGRAPIAEQNGLSPSPHCAMNGTLSMELSESRPQVANTAVARQQPIPQQFNCAQAGGSVPAFQPFFFTSTFPVNVQELVLKVRIQNPNARENDFIEVELDRRELTYRALLRVCCRELDISADHVEKIRKLPNTMLRKDKDVARLQDFQELEVVLEKAEGLSLLSAGGQGGLTDRPCYNMKASRLTY
ncbi:ankyrin repeat domain-containing protein 40 [Anguilla rostrata]|uniref:ankyrin repeat domain-containing protein 40 n=1 Tax=Anguilla anguilla TaxID=7936 RepID=UPI0015B0E61B|nr:ankyrin repeat domain-containing protein 40 [Anguilla anguilla]